MTTITTGATTAAPALVPVFTGTLQGQSVQLCDARTLHAFMVVLRDFTDWIKGRIRKFGFVEGVDFAIVANLSSPEKGSSKARAQKLTDYHLSLDMAKELSMVENNPKGREARRYFIDCEKQVLAALSDKFTPATTITPAQAQHLRELVDLVVASGKQGYPDTWSRLHRKMHVNSYLALRHDQFDAACQYLKGKFDDTSIATLIQKHLPGAVSAIGVKPMVSSLAPAIAIADISLAYALAAQVADQAARTVFDAVLAGDDDWRYERWLFTLNHDRTTGQPSVPWAKAIERDAYVLNAAGIARALVEPGNFSRHEMLEIANAVNQRMFSAACNDGPKGIGAQVTKLITRDLPQTDLREIATSATLELWMRSQGETSADAAKGAAQPSLATV